jgi:L-threonylcarbamoyladenylate synthase
VLDLTSSPSRLLRPGMIDEQTLLVVTGKLSVGFGDSEEVLKSPGQLKKHYAPKAKLVILNWQTEADLRQQILDLRFPISDCHVIAHSRIPMAKDFGHVSVIPHDAEAFARAIYAELHRCDEASAELIIVEALPETNEWRAIVDRLKRAAAQ